MKMFRVVAALVAVAAVASMGVAQQRPQAQDVTKTGVVRNITEESFDLNDLQGKLVASVSRPNTGEGPVDGMQLTCTGKGEPTPEGGIRLRNADCKK